LLEAISKTTNEGHLNRLNKALDSARKSDKALRERLMVLSVAVNVDWPTAEKLSLSFKGDYTNPKLAKVMEDHEK